MLLQISFFRVEIHFRTVLLHIFHYFFTLRLSGQVWAKLVTVQKPHFWSKIMGFLGKIAKKSLIFDNFSNNAMIFVRQDFIVFKNGNFFTLDYVLFSYGNCFCGIYRRIFAQCVPL